MITKYSYGQDAIVSKNANVIDFYKNMRTEEIRADLDKNRSDIVMILNHVNYNINIGTVIRSNNAFLGKAVYIVGRRRYDKRGTAGTSHYEHVYYSNSLKEVIDHLHSLGYTVYAVDNIMEYNPVDIMRMSFPKKSAFLFGEEGAGLSREDIKMCDGLVYIGMCGSVRSLNVACAATVVEYEYTRQWSKKDGRKEGV